MTNEPKAGDGLDPEMLAAYIDKRLPPDERAAVEARLATDPDSYELLVELIHANEALKDEQPQDEQATEPAVRPEPQAKTGAVVPLVPKPARTRGWAIAGGVLAAAAALVLVVRLQPELLQRLRGGDAVDPQLAKLVAAVGEERYIEARLTGGFKYGPLRSVTRGSGDLSQQNLALLAAAGELQKSSQAQPTPENLRRWGSAAILLERWDEGVRALERAASAASSDAATQADLSAAYLARAQSLGRAEDLPLALAAAERALKFDPTLLEALFNRALSLELLHLTEEAQKAWLEYAGRDSSPWGDLARKKAARPTAANPDEEWRQALAGYEQVNSGLEQLFAKFPEASLRLSEMQWPAEWAQAVINHDEAAARLWQQRLVDSGVTLERTLDDRLVASFAAFIAGLSVPRRAAVASAVVDYHRARALSDAYAFSDAAEVFSTTVVAMREQGNPLSIVALLEHAGALRASRQIDKAAALLPALDAGARDYPSVRARVQRLTALVRVAEGRYSEAIEGYQAASDSFRRIGFRRSESLTAILMAEVLAMVGSNEIWKYHAVGLRLAESGASPRDMQSIAFTAGSLAMNQGIPEAADHFFVAMITAAERIGVPAAVAEARLNRAKALTALGANSELERELAAANAIVSTLPPGSHGDFLRGEWASARAESLLKTDPAETLAVAGHALEYAHQKNRVNLIPRLRLVSGRALISLGRDVEAAATFESGIAAFESLWRNVTQDALRISHFDSAWELYEDLAALQMRSSEPLRALSTLERSQARSLLLARATPMAEWNLHRLEAGLNSDAAIVYFMPAERVTYAWVVRSTGTKAFDIAISRDEIQQAARDSVAALLEVGGRLLNPVSGSLRDVRSIGLVTPGVVSQIPWAGVTVLGGSLLDQATVQLLPSGSFALPGETSARRRDPRVLVAAPSSGVRDGVTALPDLPRSRAEAGAIAAMYAGATLLLDDAARSEAVLANLQSHDVLHFAGHAVSNESTPSLSRLILGKGEFLSSRELAAVPSLGVKLAVLTACSTATGAVVRSEGSISISWMLLAKGVEAVLATLRPVSDRAAATFGVAFHGALLTGLTEAEALNRAQRAVRAERAGGEPEWSYFVLVGGTSHLSGGFENERD